jgi:hypothetical protein
MQAREKMSALWGRVGWSSSSEPQLWKVKILLAELLV